MIGTAEWASMVTVGRIIRPHGNRGGVVVHPETDFAAERFRAGESFNCQRPAGLDTLTVVASREHDGRWVVQFDGVTTIDLAETLRDLELRVPEAALHVLGPGGFYVHHLVGCEVKTVAGRLIGKVVRVDLGGVSMLVVGTSEVLVPFTDAICRRVDVVAKEIEIDPPEGLIELNRGL